jgi:hypothetical protein
MTTEKPLVSVPIRQTKPEDRLLTKKGGDVTVRHMPAATAAAAPNYRGLSVRLRLARVTLRESRQYVYRGQLLS